MGAVRVVVISVIIAKLRAEIFDEMAQNDNFIYLIRLFMDVVGDELLKYFSF
ncbi:hypothetical protein [Robertmurraya sp. Marseille-Q9965]